MSDYHNLPSAGGNWPDDDGFVLGLGEVPFRGSFTIMGDMGDGNPVVQAYVYTRSTWVPIAGANVTDNGTVSFYGHGEAVRFTSPALTNEGSDDTAPRIVYSLTNLHTPNGNVDFISPVS